MFNYSPIKNIDYVIDYYFILKVNKNDDISLIKKQYKKLIKEYHPDKHQSSGDEIKVIASKKIELIIEAFSILSDKEKKETYDSLLNTFIKEKPNLISKDGNPLIDLKRESYSLDFILSGEEKFSFQESQEKKVEQMVQYNETVFNLVEKSYLENPNDEKLKEAYRVQLINKKVFLDFKETFAWQELGVLNSEPVKAQNVLEYKNLVEDKINNVIDKFENISEFRLLNSKDQNLLLGSTKIENFSKENVDLVKKEAKSTLNKRKEKLLKISLEKQDFLKKMVRFRNFKKINEIKSKDFKVFLYKKEDNIVLSGFCLKYNEEEPLGIEIDHSFDNKKIEEINEQVKAYILELNIELDLTLQVIEFFNDVANNVIE